MIKPPAKPSTAQEWLAYIEALHPKSIVMGLDRIKTVADKLQLNPKFPIITVAGTNGKGSVCAMLNQIYVQCGYSTGCYTSPHLLRYNERVSINNRAISDDDLCRAFAVVDAARGEVALTYFEMGTLAAMWHFCQQDLDVCSLDIVILEVGLGGRLDAVNIFKPTCAIVTTIDLDHMEYLGDTREKIGFEKAGIYRANSFAICGDENPPQSLLGYAKEIGANLQLINRDFSVKKTKHGWQYSTNAVQLQLPKLSLVGDFQLNNAACAVHAVQLLNDILPVTHANTPGHPLTSAQNALDSPCIYAALKAVKLTGRFQQIHSQPSILVDVAHNPHAAKSLAHNLQTTLCSGRTLAVFAMLRDKDIEGVVRELTGEIDSWYLADNHSPRGAQASDLQKILLKNVKKSPMHLFENVDAALDAAYKNAAKNDRIIVFGSFYTVADAIASRFNGFQGN